jgi:hypothetical protein
VRAQFAAEVIHDIRRPDRDEVFAIGEDAHRRLCLVFGVWCLVVELKPRGPMRLIGPMMKHLTLVFKLPRIT